MFTIMEIEKIYQHFKSSSGICTDTRKIEPNCLFFALKGESFNGNLFAKQAIEKGAFLAIIDEHEYEIEGKTILVKDVLKTLQKLANYHRKQFKLPFIGITGTNGKTTSKELINSVLSQHYKTYCTAGNLNNHIGVPLTILSIKKDCEIAIIEMGANHIGEIEDLCKIAEPNYGIITNIGKAHIEGFGSKEGVIKAKSEMYNSIKNYDGLIFCNHDDQLLMSISENINRKTYGRSNSDCNAILEQEVPTLKLKWNGYSISSTLYGKYNFYNILLAICIGEYFKVPNEKIKKGIESYISSNNRSQFIQLKNTDLYLDAYNANPTSMNVAIDSFSSILSSKKVMVLGDMLELGSTSDAEHQVIVNKAKKLNIPCIFVGKHFYNVKNKFNFLFFETNNELLEWLNNNDILNKYNKILIKGSRGIRLEIIADYLIKKGS